MDDGTIRKGLTAEDRDAISRLGEHHRRIRDELGKRIVGQAEVIEQFLNAFFAGGHCLLLGVPGLAKTLMIKTLSEVLDLDFSRIQFTPDLLPSDITGTEIIVQDKVTRDRRLKFLRGPLFTNVLLADEINRTPPKTQAAMLEAMEEGHITVGGKTYDLDKPFYVLATQNPIEQEGTYPLPVAAMDRFLFEIYVGYPDREEEKSIIRRTLPLKQVPVEKVLSHEEIVASLDRVRRVPLTDAVGRFATAIVRATRSRKGEAPDFVKEFVSWGASPRGIQALILAGKSRAMLDGRVEVTESDVVAVAKPALRHRLLLNYHAEAEGVDADAIVDRIIRNLRGEEEPGEEGPGFWDRLRNWFAPVRGAA